jgi:2-methylcitrate dehydratase PrpD
MILAGGKWDTFQMLTHPGTAVLPAALAAAERTGCSGRLFLAAVAAGYEVMERMAAEFIPTVMSRGFHAGPVFGIFGAAIASAKIQGLDADQVNGTIAQCANLAAGNLEGARSGGRSLRESSAVRNALLAVAMARHSTPVEVVSVPTAGEHFGKQSTSIQRAAYDARVFESGVEGKL